MAESNRTEQVDDRTPSTRSETGSTAEHPVARMLANPRRVRRA